MMAATSSGEGSSSRGGQREADNTFVLRQLSSSDGGLSASGYSAVDSSHARILRPSGDSLGLRCPTSPGMERDFIVTGKREIEDTGTIEVRSVFSCHAFSRDGTRLAAGETGGKIQMWDTRNYSCIAETHTAARTKICALCFLDGSNASIIVVDDCGVVTKFSFLWNWRTSSHGRESKCEVHSEVKASLHYHNSITHHHSHVYEFSECGHRVAYYEPTANRDQGYSGLSRIDLYEITDDSVHVCKVMDESVSGYRLPLLSDTGCSLLICSQTSGIQVFPNLTFTIDQDTDSNKSSSMSQEPLLRQDSRTSVVVEGDRASWGKNGLFLVWSSKDGFPRLSVYKTQDMHPDQNPRPWRNFDLGLGSFSWEAKFIEGTESDDNNMAVLISEDFSHSRKRFLVWDAKKDTVNCEICVRRPERRFEKVNRDHYLENQKASSIVEGSLPVRSNDAYQIRVREDNWQKIDLSRKHGLVGFYSWQSHSCVVASLNSGVALKEISLPADEHFHPFETPVQAGFDPLGSHFVVFGDSAIFAFTEHYMCPDGQTASEEYAPAASNMSRNGSSATPTNLTQGPQTKYDHFVSLLNSLPGRALCPFLLSQTKSMDSDWNFGMYLDSMDRRHIVDAAMAPDGRCLTFLLRDDAQSYRLLTLDARKCHKRDVIGEEEPLSDGNDDAFAPERVFLHQNEPDSEPELVLVSRFPRAKALFRSVMSTPSVPFECKIAEYLIIRQTCDHRKLVLLTRDSVYLLDLHDREVYKQIQYKVKFDLLLQKVQPRDQDHWNHSSYDHHISRISDNGECVLLAWNARTRQSILVNPSSTQDTCDKQIEAAGHLTSLFCSLSWNGACTIFIDCHEQRNGRITVGFFNHEAQEVIQRQHVVEHNSLKTYKEADFFSLLQNLCFAISRDGKSLVVATTQSFHETARWYKNERFMQIPLEWSAFYRNSQTEKKESPIDEMLNIAKHSRKSLARFCNEPTRGGLSLYQTIVVEGFREKEEEIRKLANARKMDLAVEWTTESGEHDDILNHALKKNSDSCIRRAVDVLTSEPVPFSSAASIFARSFSKLLFQRADVVYSLLKNNFFVRTAAVFDVSEVFADPELRRNKAVHIRATDTCLEWKLAGCSSFLEKNWENQTANIVEASGSGNDTSVKMSLQFIQIENVAKTGSEGIIRPLLLQKMPEKFFKCDMLKWIVDYKWISVWRHSFIREFIFYLFFLVIFTLYAIQLGWKSRDTEYATGPYNITAARGHRYKETEYGMEEQRVDWATLILLTLSWISGCFALLKETTYLLTLTIDERKLSGSHLLGLSCYGSNVWNVINLILSLLIVFATPSLHLLVHRTGVYRQQYAMIVAMEVVLAYAKVWYYTLPFSSTEGLVFTVGSIFSDSWKFLLLMLSVWFGFAVAMFVVSAHATGETPGYDACPDEYSTEVEQNVKHQFGSIQMSLVTLLTGAILGDYNTEVYHLEGLAAQGVACTLILYVLVQTLLLLNSLYSMMGDSCQKARALQRIFLAEGRARVIDACEASSSASTLQKINESIKTYLCALTPTEETHETQDDSEGWVSMTAELEKVLGKKIAESKKELKAVLDEKLTTLENRIAKMCDEMRTMQER